MQNLSYYTFVNPTTPTFIPHYPAHIRVNSLLDLLCLALFLVFRHFWAESSSRATSPSAHECTCRWASEKHPCYCRRIVALVTKDTTGYGSNRSKVAIYKCLYALYWSYKPCKYLNDSCTISRQWAWWSAAQDLCPESAGRCQGQVFSPGLQL